MCRFYGWGWVQAEEMDIGSFSSALKAVEVLEAQEFIMNSKLSDWSQMKDSARSEMYTKLKRAAFPNGTGSEASLEDLENMLQGL